MTATSANTLTLKSYDRRFRQYIAKTANTVSGPMKEWIDRALENLSLDAKILEIGSAFGRDAAYIRKLGFDIECTDATMGFVEHLKGQKFNAKKLDVLADPIIGTFDLVFANAVLVHFTRAEFAFALENIFGRLENNGMFAFSLLHGEGELWSSEKIGAPRYFCLWARPGIESLLDQAGFASWTIQEDTADNKKHWLQIIACKKASQ